MDHRSASRGLVRISLLASVWALGYALYRAYYGLGGTFGMFGVVRSEATWREINLLAAGILAVAAVLPMIALPLWDRPRIRLVLLAVAWVVFVGCVGHGLIDDIVRVGSLAGLSEVYYPPELWVSVDRFAADVQDLVFNETWFIVEGLLWAGIAWLALGPSSARRWWVGTAVVAITVFVVAGLLSAAGITGRFVVGWG